MSWKNVKMNPLIARLPRESHGYPVPQFVHKPEGWESGEPLDMRVLNVEEHLRCATKKLCAVCGGGLYAKMFFIGGPMCLANRIFGDGGLHRDCAEYSLAVCPHLSQDGAKYSQRPSEASLHDELVVRERPPYLVLVQTRGYTVITHYPPPSRQPLPKPVLRIQPWDRCTFLTNDGKPTTDRYAVITNPLGTALYCFACIERGVNAISYNPSDVEHLYCASCHRYLADDTQPGLPNTFGRLDTQEEPA